MTRGMNRRLSHHLCMLLLLATQQVALAHAAWHARVQPGKAATYEQDHAHPHQAHDHGEVGHGGSDVQSSLCAFDLAFGQVLGGVHGASAPLVTAELPAVPGSYRFIPRHGSDAVPEISRGPPARL